MWSCSGFVRIAFVFVTAIEKGIDDHLSLIRCCKIAGLLAGIVPTAEFNAMHRIDTSLVVEAAVPEGSAAVYKTGNVIWCFAVVAADEE